MTDPAQEPIIEIRDPELDAQAIRQCVSEGVARRRAAGAYGPDPASVGPEALRSSTQAYNQPERPDLNVQALHQSMADMSGRAHLHELTFRSQVPILGRLIAAVRTLWGGMAARWIGRHLMDQQSDFNRAAVEFGGELLQWQDAHLWRQRQLEEKVRLLEARLARLEDGDSAALADREETT